jgi:hypothetical protein
MIWYPPYWEDPDSEDEEEYQQALHEALELAEERYPSHGTAVFASNHKRHLSEAIPSTERLNSQEVDAVQVNGEGSAALADGDDKIPEEVPSVSRYGRKRRY